MTVQRPPLPASFLLRPIAHRGLHDKSSGVPENSLAAFRAAVDQGFGIELDLQASQDGKAVVFHDYDLTRLTGQTGALKDYSSEFIQKISLLGNERELVPTLPEVLDLVDGRVPILIEIKDQDGAMGPNIGEIETDIAEQISDYSGPIAVMSFNPYSVLKMATLAPHVPRGLTTYSWNDKDAAGISGDRLRALLGMKFFDQAECSFISHDVHDLDSPHVSAMKARGVPVLCWTVKSKKSETRARKIADNVTFEGYLPT